VLFLGHRENEPMGDYGTLRSRRKFRQMLLPGFGDALFALRVGELRGCRAGAVRIHSDAVMQESASVDLSERFLRIVGKVLELFADLLIHIGSLAKRNFSAGCFVNGGAASRVAASETAFAQRHAQYSIGILAQWTNPGESQRHIEWARGLADSTRPFSSGAYLLNFLGDEGEDTIKAAFGPSYERLKAIKKKYDPENFFRLNQNIKP
jgi:hypothetical protein